MTRKLQILRGTTAQNNAYTGAVGELTMDTDTNEVRIHDGQTVGGIKIGKRNMPILTPKWFDHQVNDESWLNADTFSWQPEARFARAYEHLVADSRCYAWRTSNGYCYSDSEMPLGTMVVHVDSNGAFLGYEQLAGSMGDGYVVNASGEQYTRDSSADATWVDLGVLYTTDTIGDITITYYKAEDGHKICAPDQESNIVALYENTGIAWYYILDTENKQFKLPRTKWGFTGLRDSVGGYVEPALPNIKDSLQLVGSGSSGFYGESTGALYASGSSTTQFANISGGDTRTHVNIDASRSSTIYKDGATVQPPATQMYLYFYVGDFEQSATEQTAGLNAELFNNKADTDLGNIPANYDYVVETQLPTSANGYTWYRKYKSGWVEQGGYSSAITGTVNITLPIEMLSNVYNIRTQALIGSGVSDTTSVNRNAARVYIRMPSNQTTTGFSFPVSGDMGQIGTYWQVSGMSAQ